MAVSVTITSTPGLFSSTAISNNAIQLGPAPTFTTFPGDTSWWSVSTTTATWVASGDVFTCTNTDGSQSYVYAVYNFSQSAAHPITFRVTGSGNCKSGSFNVELHLTDMSGNTIYDDTLYFPNGVFQDTQLEFDVTPSAPVHYATMYIYAHGEGTLSVSDAQLYDSTSANAPYGEWTSNIYDLAKLANQSIAKNGIALANWGFYYENLSNVDNFYSVTHSIDVLSRFDYLVCNEPSQNTSSREQYVQQQLISAGKKLFGYVNIGVSEEQYNYCLPPVSVVTAAIDRCASAGYAGVFFDGAASNGSNPMEYMNYLANYVIGKGLLAMYNGHPQDLLYTTADNYHIANPTLTPSVSAVSDASSTLAAGTYTVGVTFAVEYTNGETELSPTTTVTVASGQAIAVTTTENQHNSVGNVIVYISDAPGSSTLRKAYTGYGMGEHITAVPASTEPTPPASNTAWTGNHNGISSTIPSNFWLIWESFFSRSDNQYAGVPEGSFADVMAEYIAANTYLQAHPVQMAGLAYQLSSISDSDSSDWIKTWLLAVALGWNGISYTAGTSTANVPWSTPPTFPNVGSKITTAITNTHTLQWETVTDGGVIQIAATDSPVTRTFAAFANKGPWNFTATVPTVTATVVDTSYYGSDDMNTWAAITPPVSPNRFIRMKYALRS